MKKTNSQKAKTVAEEARAILREFAKRLEEIHQEALALVRTHEQKKIATVRQNIKGMSA